MMRSSSKPSVVSIEDKGWSVVCTCVAVIRLDGLDGVRGFAVGVQRPFRSSGTGRVWPGLKKARNRAAELAALNNLPVVESI